MTALNFLTPLLAVLLGALITYWLNVRARRRSHVEDLFADAIAAVRVAEASKDYIRSVAPWSPDLSREEYVDFLNQLGREAAEDHIRKAAAAREALARVLEYRPELHRYYRGNATAVFEQADEIVALLRKGPVGSTGRSWPPAEGGLRPPAGRP